MIKGLLPVEWWFSGTQSQQYERWFQSNPIQQKILDKFIVEHFGRLHTITEKSYIECSEWHESQISNQYSKHPLAKKNKLCLFQDVIVLDQFSRHIYRGDPDKLDKIHINTEIAAKIAIYLLESNICLDESYSANEQAFVLMPLKHYNVKFYFPLIMKHLQKFDYTKHPQLMRFYKDLIKKYSKIQNIEQAKFVEICNFGDDCLENFKQITEWNENGFIEFFNINYFPLLTGIRRKLVQIVKDHLNLHLKTLENQIVTVSLSGGVDSMVLCYILVHLQNEFKFPLQAYHYNGKNRPESDLEADFVQYYCQVLNIPICIRSITEVQRRDNDRELYEAHTRNIRFDMYKLIGKGGAIVLGHIHDDITENIWTNFARGRDLFNLKKMRHTDKQDNVILWRPFLNVEKSDILLFAQELEIWYLLNSTPSWSNRGKFRETFLPAINTQYGIVAHQNVEFLANSLEEYNTFLHSKLFAPFLSKIQPIQGIQPMVAVIGYTIPIDQDHIGLGLHFWQIIFSEILHPLGIGLPSRKSLETMIQVLKSSTDTTARSSMMITLKHELYIQWIDKKVLVILFKKELVLQEIVNCTEQEIGAKHWGEIQKKLKLNYT
jgi:tRNA(Ile)-lysidine synthetase-like protein